MSQGLIHSVASEIRAEMARQRIKQRQLSEVLGVSQAQVSARLQGKVPIDVAELEKIAKFLGVPVTNLISVRAAERAA